jgi:HTH-type transcriptional regulator/antitoxin HigA
MNIKPIRCDEDLQAAFQRLEHIFQAAEGTPEADEMEILVTLIEAYENKHYPITPPDPVEAIKFRMEQQGLTPKDLQVFIGSSGRVSEGYLWRPANINHRTCKHRDFRPGLAANSRSLRPGLIANGPALFANSLQTSLRAHIVCQ